MKDEEYIKVFEEIKSFFSKYEIINIKEIGKRKLAYEVKGNNEGYFVVLEYKANNESKKEIQHYYRKNENILRFIIVDKEI